MINLLNHDVQLATLPFTVALNTRKNIGSYTNQLANDLIKLRKMKFAEGNIRDTANLSPYLYIIHFGNSGIHKSELYLRLNFLQVYGCTTGSKSW